MRSIIAILISLSVVGILVTPSIADDVDAISVSNSATNGYIPLEVSGPALSTERAVERETMTLSRIPSPSHSSQHEVIRC